MKNWINSLFSDNYRPSYEKPYEVEVFKENTLEDIFNCLRLDEINEMICDYELAEKYENGLNKLVINFKNDYPSIR